MVLDCSEVTVDEAGDAPTPLETTAPRLPLAPVR